MGRVVFCDVDQEALIVGDAGQGVIEYNLPEHVIDLLKKRGYLITFEGQGLKEPEYELMLMKPIRQSADLKNLFGTLVRQQGVKEVAGCLAMVAHGELAQQADTGREFKEDEERWLKKLESLLD